VITHAIKDIIEITQQISRVCPQAPGILQQISYVEVKVTEFH